mmetsp:Transcript_26364/g.78795  ORF Transcript_26364/g.78795 Transcript_26364/m.78795 type:complete len:522 (+) Transcript_26364:330-1895(+)
MAAVRARLRHTGAATEVGSAFARTARCASEATASSSAAICTCVSCSWAIDCACASRVSRQRRLTPSAAASPPGDGSGGGGIARPSLVTLFIGSVTTLRSGSVRVSDSSCGATWMRKRCLSRWLDREVIRSLKVAAPCSATTSVSPTSSGSERLVCLTAEPFSYRSVARSGSEQSTMGTSAESCTPTLSVKGRRFDTTSSSSLSPFSRVLISTLCTRCSRMRSLRPLMTTAVLLQLGATVAIAVVVAGAAAAAAGAASSSGGAAFPGAAGEFGSGADASPPSFPPAFPPPPPPSPPTRADEWLAYKIQVGATVAVGCVIGVFYLVEFARRHGCNLRLLSARQQQVVLTVFTQTDERRAAVAVSSSTMRRGDEYLPPLTKSILLLLGLDGARTTAHHVATHVARSSSLASAKPTTPRLGRLRSRAMSTGTGGAVCVSMIPETTPRRSSSFGTAAAAPAPPAADGAAAAPDPTRSARTAAAQHLQAAAAEQLRAQQPPPPQHTSLDLRSAPSDEGGGGLGHGAV